MIIYLAASKTMDDSCGEIVPEKLTEPLFAGNASVIAHALNEYSASELQQILKINGALAMLNKKRYMDFDVPSASIPAAWAYTGTAYKSLDVRSWNAADVDFAQKHLLIGSFLYGLLRPLDAIHPYRLEGNVTLPALDHKSIFDYWKPILTEQLIDAVKADDGTLVNLASSEYTRLFDWKRVCKELTVVSPVFKVDFGGKEKVVALYAKMCRGAMTRWLVLNQSKSPRDITRFQYQGFANTVGYEFSMMI